MPSHASVKFQQLTSRASLLTKQGSRLRKKTDQPAKIIFLHAALTAQVAAWDVYIKGVALEYFSATADPANARFSAMHSMLNQRMQAAAKKLNTPNSNKCREFLISHTGFDPWPSWVNVKFGPTLLTATLLVRTRLDEVFDVRHSFAHGFTMPAHAWNSDSSGAAHLSCKILDNTNTFFSELCVKTDLALSNHIAAQHGITKPW